MKSRLFIVHTVFLFSLLFGPSLLMAQKTLSITTTENQQKNLERQMEMAENQMRTVENLQRLHSFGQSENRSSLVLSKRYDGETVSKVGNFVVDEETREVQLSINGEVDSGMIVLEIKKPTGEVLKTLVMDDTADIRWEQTLAINKENGAQYTGKWTYKITTEKARGEYRLSIRTK